MNEFEKRISSIGGATLNHTETGRKIRLSRSASKADLEKLLEVLRDNNMEFSLYDEYFPPYTKNEPDPGAYISYSQEKAESGCWSMTLGNNGWSGGIYHINTSTICLQLQDLIEKEETLEIDLDDVSFFSHYKVKSTKKSRKENIEIIETHAGPTK